MKLKKDIFFIVGAQRCGTTLLYDLLSRHPQILMNEPVKPEPKFFLNSHDFDNGETYYLQKFFAGYEDAGIKVLGEKSTSYLEYGVVASRIKAMFPTAKIVVMLRDPVERALSNFYFSTMNGIEKRELSIDIFSSNTNSYDYTSSVSPFAYFERGLYHKYLRDYLNVFGSNLHVVILEALLNTADEFLTLTNFLNVPALPISSQPDAINVSQKTPTSHAHLQSIKSTLRMRYRPSIENLEKLLNIDLSIWKQ